MAKYSFLLGEYTENEQVYHFGLRGKCYYINSKTGEGKEQNIYESSNMNEAYAKWKDIKGGKTKPGSRLAKPGSRDREKEKSKA